MGNAEVATWIRFHKIILQNCLLCKKHMDSRVHHYLLEEKKSIPLLFDMFVLINSVKHVDVSASLFLLHGVNSEIFNWHTKMKCSELYAYILDHVLPSCSSAGIYFSYGGATHIIF